LVISGLTLPADYNLSGADTTCTASTSLAPAASCVLGIVFAPTASGALNESLTVTDNLGTQTINLTGTGVAASVPPVPIVTTTTLTVPTPPLASGQAVTLTATVAPAPTGSSKGTVSFLDGATLLGTSNVNSSGVATFSAQGLADGDHHVTAVYSGNSTSAVSTSAAVTVTITPATTTPQFNVTAPTAPVSATPGSPVNVTIGVPPIGTFNSQVTMSASGLPAGATATFNPPVVTPGSTGAHTVMTVTFAKTVASTQLPAPSQPTQRIPPAPLALFAISALGLSAMLTQKLAVRFPRPLTAAFTTACLLVASVAVVGCNGGFAGPSANTPAPQTVVVTVTGTSGSIKHSTIVTIHLQ
jgi:hypothetical protein